MKMAPLRGSHGSSSQKRNDQRPVSSSRGTSVVELQQATEPFTTLDLASDRTDLFIWLNQLIAQPLMIPLRVVVLDVVGSKNSAEL